MANLSITSNKTAFRTSLEVGNTGTSAKRIAYFRLEDAMMTYFNNLPTKTWLLLVIPAVVLAYPVVRIVVPAVLHAVVPDVVRSVLSVI